jgi:hypothetical protein
VFSIALNFVPPTRTIIIRLIENGGPILSRTLKLSSTSMGACNSCVLYSRKKLGLVSVSHPD